MFPTLSQYHIYDRWAAFEQLWLKEDAELTTAGGHSVGILPRSEVQVYPAAVQHRDVASPPTTQLPGYTPASSGAAVCSLPHFGFSFSSSTTPFPLQPTLQFSTILIQLEVPRLHSHIPTTGPGWHPILLGPRLPTAAALLEMMCVMIIRT